LAGVDDPSRRSMRSSQLPPNSDMIAGKILSAPDVKDTESWRRRLDFAAIFSVPLSGAERSYFVAVDPEIARIPVAGISPASQWLVRLMVFGRPTTLAS